MIAIAQLKFSVSLVLIVMQGVKLVNGFVVLCGACDILLTSEIYIGIVEVTKYQYYSMRIVLFRFVTDYVQFRNHILDISMRRLVKDEAVDNYPQNPGYLPR